MNELVQFVRNRNGQPRGVLVATNQGVGWSAVNPRDKFDKGHGIDIARVRAQARSLAGNPPRHIQEALPDFHDRATRYFKRYVVLHTK